MGRWVSFITAQVAIEPLTIEPSVLCRQCGSHGWIKDGAWVPDVTSK